MRLFIGLVTPDEDLRRLYRNLKSKVVPRDAIRRGYFSNIPLFVETAVYSPSEQASAPSFERFLIQKAGTAQACMILLDREWEPMAANCRNAAFTIEFEKGDVDESRLNFFHRTLARALRSFGQLAAKFDRGDDAQLLTLPLRNFDAPELREIARLCRDEHNTADFGNVVEAELALLRRRVCPRKKSTYKTRYAVDDRRRFFKYGHERHSRLATGTNHQPYCELTGNLRFGRRFDSERHYNVSETEKDNTNIEGFFADCHVRYMM